MRKLRSSQSLRAGQCLSLDGLPAWTLTSPYLDNDHLTPEPGKPGILAILPSVLLTQELPAWPQHVPAVSQSHPAPRDMMAAAVITGFPFMGSRNAQACCLETLRGARRLMESSGAPRGTFYSRSENRLGVDRGIKEMKASLDMLSLNHPNSRTFS